MLESFHFLRPMWFLGFLPLSILLILLVRQRVGSQSWEAVCDAHLLPHLLVGNNQLQSRGPYILLATVWSLCLLALAGPVWSKLPQPVFRAQSALVLILDLSRSMNAEDVSPSRLTRAKHKVRDILKHRQEGQTALVVYAGEPYIVSPLTDDANTIAAMVSSLDTELMPSQGSRPDLALLQAEKLLEQSDVQNGQVLLITDGVENDSIHTIVKNVKKKHHISVLGVGTIDGAPIPQSTGFVKDESGAIVIPKLNPQALADLAMIGNGRYATLTIDDKDLESVLPTAWEFSEKNKGPNQHTTDLWREEGPWIILGMLALAIPAFRPGWLGAMLVFFLFTPSPGHAFFGEEWWSRPDQRAARAMQQGEPGKAAALFEDSSWRGVAHYRSGDYEKAAEDFNQDHSADGHFNRGNALARTGKLQEALHAYQTALTQAPTHEDAKHNYELIEKLLKQQEQQQNSESKGEESQDDQSSKSQQPESEQSQQNAEQQGGDQSSKNPQANQQSNSAPNESDDESSQNSERQSIQSPSDSSEEQQGRHTDLGEQGNPEDRTGEDEERTSGSLADSQENLPDDENQEPMTTAGLSKEENVKLESRQAMEQWLRRIPDDPGGLLRRKFLFEHRRRQESGQFNSSGNKTW